MMLFFGMAGNCFYLSTHKIIMENIIQRTRQALEKSESAKLTAIQNTLKQLEQHLDMIPLKRSSIHERKDIEKQIETLKQSQIDIMSGDVMREFEDDSQKFLQQAAGDRENAKNCTHIDRSQSFLQQSTSSGRQARKKTTARDMKISSATTLTATNGASKELLHDEYMQKYNGKNPTLYMSVGSECSRCHEKMSRVDCAMVCEQCGISETYIDDDSVTFSEDIEYSNFSYRRISHFTDWLGSFQARGRNTIPDDVLHTVMHQLKQRKIKDLHDITPTLVREILKQERLQKYYDQTMLISCLLSGRTPPRLTPHEEATLKTMFLQIQPVFEKHCPSTRKNFLSYSYVLYKLCELLGLPYYKDGSFTLLKCPEKNRKMDEIWKLICRDLRWEFVPSTI
jgi:hypothetical protein